MLKNVNLLRILEGAQLREAAEPTLPSPRVQLPDEDGLGVFMSEVVHVNFKYRKTLKINS